MAELKRNFIVHNKEIRVKGVPEAVKKDLEVIALNLGVSPGAIIKTHLPEIIGKYEDKYKKPSVI